MIAGAGGNVATAGRGRAGRRRGRAGNVPVPGRARRADLIDAAFLGGTAAHGIELDDGYTKGSVHPGCTVVPAVLVGRLRQEGERRGTDRGDGRGLRDRHRDRPRGASRPAPPRLPSDRRGRGVRRGDGGRQAARTVAAAIVERARHRGSSSAGLFAFVNGGADIKRLHAGHASREGLQAALLAEAGRRRPARRDRGARRLHAGLCLRTPTSARPVELPPDGAVRHHRLLHQAESRAAATSSRRSRR